MRYRKQTFALFAAAVTSTAMAGAAPPASLNAIQIDGGFRYGFDQEEGDFNPWGPGIGIAIGYTLPSAVYLGGNVDYFFGDDIETPTGELKSNVFQFMAEGGYDLGLNETLVLRPKLGAGLAVVKTKFCETSGSCTTESPTDFAIAPGVAFLYLGESFSFGVDLRYDLVFADEETLNAILLAIGIGF